MNYCCMTWAYKILFLHIWKAFSDIEVCRNEKIEERNEIFTMAYRIYRKTINCILEYWWYKLFQLYYNFEWKGTSRFHCRAMNLLHRCVCLSIMQPGICAIAHIIWGTVIIITPLHFSIHSLWKRLIQLLHIIYLVCNVLEYI